MSTKGLSCYLERGGKLKRNLGARHPSRGGLGKIHSIFDLMRDEERD